MGRYGVTLFLMLTPWPTLDSSDVAVWFGLTYILFFLCNTFCNIPYDALLVHRRHAAIVHALARQRDGSDDASHPSVRVLTDACVLS